MGVLGSIDVHGGGVLKNLKNFVELKILRLGAAKIKTNSKSFPMNKLECVSSAIIEGKF